MVEASVFSFFTKILLASPVTYLAFFLVVPIPLLAVRGPRFDGFLWLLAALLNLPSLHLLYLASTHYGSWVDGNTDHLVDMPSWAFVETLVIYFFGTGGAGLGLVLSLFCRPIFPTRFVTLGISAIFSRNFWKAKRPD